MNGPEHYAEAERLSSVAAQLLQQASEPENVPYAGQIANGSAIAAVSALAQVHATLALAAAVRGPSDATWIEVLK